MIRLKEDIVIFENEKEFETTLRVRDVESKKGTTYPKIYQQRWLESPWEYQGVRERWFELTKEQAIKILEYKVEELQEEIVDVKKSVLLINKMKGR